MLPHNYFILLHCKGNTLFVTKDCSNKKAVTYLKNPKADLALIQIGNRMGLHMWQKLVTSMFRVRKHSMQEAWFSKLSSIQSYTFFLCKPKQRF